jgi:hypothetical protein
VTYSSCRIKRAFHGGSSQIREELVRLFFEQTEFYRDGARTKHTETELAECEKRRERIRGLFAELDELRKVE